MLGAFRVCNQRAYFEYILGLRESIPSIDLHAGGAFASAREALYKASYSGFDRQQSLTAARQAFETYLRIDKFFEYVFLDPKRTLFTRYE